VYKSHNATFSSSAGAAFGGMNVTLEKTLYKVTFSAWAPRWFPPFAPQLFLWSGKVLL
jgi:hypothetical protein